MDILNTINSPSDLKKLKINDLSILADEIRQVILKKASEVGGHLGSNLGIIELIISLHYVFNSPTDKIVFDVSHQSYAHKILTGRKEYFIKKDKYNDISGFTDPYESPHDLFKTGHTSTSISQALGLAIARDSNKTNENIIAIIGDGALSGGEAFEGLNNASVYKNNLIIIINDNKMSIAENKGGLYNHISKLRDTKGKSRHNIFKSLGFKYDYIEDGNNIPTIIEKLKKYHNVKKPLILHVHTTKGYGLKYAEDNKEKWHKIKPFDLNTGIEKESIKENTIDFTINKLISLINKNDKIKLITAGTPSSIGLYPKIRDKIKNNLIDVGIAESHAVSFAAGLAKNDNKPVFIVQSSFIQRAYDQIAEDLCINNLPAVIIINKAGIFTEDATHLGYFDIPLLCNIPNLYFLVPSTKDELESMLTYATENKTQPIVIRLSDSLDNDIKNEIIDFDKKEYSILERGSKVSIIGLGNFLKLAYQTKELLKKYNIKPTIINPHAVLIDNKTLDDLKQDHELVVVLEDGCLAGGFGEKIAEFYSTSNTKVLTFGAQKEFAHRIKKDILYKKYHLEPELITKDILNNLSSDKKTK